VTRIVKMVFGVLCLGIGLVFTMVAVKALEPISKLQMAVGRL
jgi:hypothetical protein